MAVFIMAKLYDGKFNIQQTIKKYINYFRLEILCKNHNIIPTETNTKPLQFEIEQTNAEISSINLADKAMISLFAK